MQNAGIIAKYHSNQLKVKMYYAKTVSKLQGHQEEITIDLETIDETTSQADLEKCTKQPVANAENLAKSRSNQHQEKTYFVANASKQEEIK